MYRGADKSLPRPGRKQATSMSKSSGMMDPTRSREMPSCSTIDLAEIRRSSKISSWIWSIISGVVELRTYQHHGISHLRNTGVVKIKFSLCLMKHVAMKMNGGGGIAPRILILVTRWRWMVFTGYEAGWDTGEKGKISTPAENWTAVFFYFSLFPT